MGALAWLVTPAAAQVATTDYTAAIQRGRLIMSEIVQQAGVPGMSVAVGVDGEVVWTQGFGFADLEQRVPATEATLFRVGSVSKSLTAAAVGLLIEEGLLDLDAPVQQYVPTFPEKRWPITTRQLGGHLSGIRHYLGDEMYGATHYEHVLDGLEIFQDDTLLFEPGTRYSYSSYAWNLLSAVVESAAGIPFLQYMRQRVFDPIAMQETSADHNDSLIPRRTRFYERTRSGIVLNAPYVDNSYKWAGGGFIATTADLARFGMALTDGEFLAPETLEILWTSQHLDDGSPTGYGIGWSVGTDHDGRRVVSHSGGSIGGTAFLLLFPDHGLVVATLANSSAPMRLSTAWAIAEPFLPPVPVDLSYQDHRGTYACTYQGRDNAEQAATLYVVGPPDDYAVRFTTGNITADGLQAWSAGRTFRAVVIENGFSIGNIWLTVTGETATGHWNNVALTCDVQ
jgi:CubicO group peptidase (beta-lactamase class C family)